MSVQLIFESQEEADRVIAKMRKNWPIINCSPYYNYSIDEVIFVDVTTKEFQEYEDSRFFCLVWCSSSCTFEEGLNSVKIFRQDVCISGWLDIVCGISRLEEKC